MTRAVRTRDGRTLWGTPTQIVSQLRAIAQRDDLTLRDFLLEVHGRIPISHKRWFEIGPAFDTPETGDDGMCKMAVNDLVAIGILERTTPTPAAPPRPPALAAMDVLADGAEAFAEAFDKGEPVAGADVVEWFAAWRLRARAAIGAVECDRDEDLT